MLTQMRLKELLRYDPESGAFYWLASGKGRKLGAHAGNLCPSSGYWRIYIDGRRYQAHRLAFLYVTGEFPQSAFDIDHINGGRGDNCFINLRIASRAGNAQNTGVYKNNTSGFRGVSFHAGENKWMALCIAFGVRHHLGYFDSPEVAGRAYKDFARKAYGEFYPEGKI